MADVSRQSWIDNTSLENVRIADRVFVLLNQASEYVYAPGYTQSYIGVRSGNKPCNFFTVTPKKKDSVISIRVTQTAETDAAVKAASTDGTFQYKDGWYGVHLDPNGDYTPLIPVLLQAEKEFKKEKGDTALTKTSEWKEAADEMAELEKNAQMEDIAGLGKQSAASKPLPKADKKESCDKSSALKRFKIVIEVRNVETFEMADIEDDVIIDNDEDILEDLVEEYSDIAEYMSGIAIGDEWGDDPDNFHITVYDENSGKIVYEGDEIYDFMRISETPIEIGDLLDLDEDDDAERIKEIRNKINFKKIEQSFNNECEERKNGLLNDNGTYSKNTFVRVHSIKCTELIYFIEDNEFDPDKLIFVSNPLMEEFGYDYYTDEKHIFYGEDFLEIAEDDYDYLDYDEWGCEYKIINRHIGNKWGKEVYEVDVLYSE